VKKLFFNVIVYSCFLNIFLVRGNGRIEGLDMLISTAKPLTNQRISHITTCFSEFNDRITSAFFRVIFPHSKESNNHFFVFKEKIHAI